jgi:hypothetical protein
VAGRGGGNSAQAAATLPTATVQEGFPTPASLAEVMLSTRQMLIEHAGECILVSSRDTLSSLYILENEYLGVT